MTNDKNKRAESSQAETVKGRRTAGLRKKRAEAAPLRRFDFDNSAKFYPVIASKKMQSLYCMGAVLKDEVDPEILKKAVNEVIKRFPSLKVEIKKGYSWHYLRENTREVKIFPSDDYMLRPIDPEVTNGYWFRVSYGKNHIKVDMFHGLTDGNGALYFLKAVLFCYQQLRGVEVPDKMDIWDWRDVPVEEETEDSFYKYYKPIRFSDLDLKLMAGGEPHRMTGTPVDGGYLTTLGRAKVDDIKLRAKAIGVTFTAYVTGIIAYTIEKISHTEKPIVIMIPVNLRNIFPSFTVRNFVTFVRVVINPSCCRTLEQFAEECNEQLKEKSTKTKMEEFISTTVRAQGNILLKALPLFVKSFFVNIGRKLMRSRQTIIFSNIGKVLVPKQLGLERFIFHMNVSKFNPQNIGAVTIGDYVTFAFTRAIKETALTEAFFKNLAAQGIEVEIDEELSNGVWQSFCNTEKGTASEAGAVNLSPAAAKAKLS